MFIPRSVVQMSDAIAVGVALPTQESEARRPQEALGGPQGHSNKNTWWSARPPSAWEGGWSQPAPCRVRCNRSGEMHEAWTGPQRKTYNHWSFPMLLKSVCSTRPRNAERRTGTPTVQDLSESDTRGTVRNYDYESCYYICEGISCTDLWVDCHYDPAHPKLHNPQKYLGNILITHDHV